PVSNLTSKLYRIASTRVSPSGGVAAPEPDEGFKRQYARAAITGSKRSKAMYTVRAPPKRNHAKAAPCSSKPGAGDGATIRPAFVTSKTEDFVAPRALAAGSSRR